MNNSLRFDDGDDGDDMDEVVEVDEDGSPVTRKQKETRRKRMDLGVCYACHHGACWRCNEALMKRAMICWSCQWKQVRYFRTAP